MIARRAKADLLQIWRFSADQWGDAQATLYTDRIDAAFASLCERPETGPLGVKGFRRWRVGRHVIYYRADESTVRVERVLHSRMDAQLRLG